MEKSGTPPRDIAIISDLLIFSCLKVEEIFSHLLESLDLNSIIYNYYINNSIKEKLKYKITNLSTN